MIVRLGIRHHLAGEAARIRTDLGDPRAAARRQRPNALEALALFESDWRGREIEDETPGILAITVLLDHAGATAGMGRRVQRTAEGWAATVCLTRDQLMRGTAERSIGEIADELERQATEIVIRVTLMPPRLEARRDAGGGIRRH
jgi:hypothetical protein